MEELLIVKVRCNNDAVVTLCRPFLNTKESKVLGYDGYLNFRDQVGSFMGGLNDTFEGRDNSLTFTGRQKIADRLWPWMVDSGNKLRRGKPADIRAFLEDGMAQSVDAEEMGKFMRFSMECAKIDEHLNSGISLSTKIDEKLLAKADADPFISGYFGKRKDTLQTIGNNQGIISVETMTTSSGQWKKVRGVWLDESARGKGLADAAINQLVGKDKSFALIEPENKASQALFKRLGYEQTGLRGAGAKEDPSKTYQLCRS